MNQPNNPQPGYPGQQPWNPQQGQPQNSYPQQGQPPHGYPGQPQQGYQSQQGYGQQYPQGGYQIPGGTPPKKSTGKWIAVAAVVVVLLIAGVIGLFMKNDGEEATPAPSQSAVETTEPAVEETSEAPSTEPVQEPAPQPSEGASVDTGGSNDLFKNLPDGAQLGNTDALPEEAGGLKGQMNVGAYVYMNLPGSTAVAAVPMEGFPPELMIAALNENGVLNVEIDGGKCGESYVDPEEGSTFVCVVGVEGTKLTGTVVVAGNDSEATKAVAIDVRKHVNAN